eukprot:CAMPEP_0176462602 /NCGR_PEP_ID=MMETSP0127-20121128/35374_1 /TAXON_ID=938130 /ORGANISM="Platyophrya macrostoma, Strain WH" /LENGTH=206 /DNA_ID=CAMNT_0017854569 /DNA_START=12 /DNA_END=628 /DNA_ORIENTATION=+
MPESILMPSQYFDTVDMKTFMMSPAPKNYLIQCSIKREKTTFGFFSKYYLMHGSRILMAGKKQAGNRTSTYAIAKTEFNIWDHGLKHTKAKTPDQLRQQLGVVVYEQNFLGSKGPRKMHVRLPEVTNGEINVIKPTSKKDGMLDMKTGFKEYYNKPPRWSEQYSAFVLNFNGRVEMPSVKNFQLVHESNEDYIVLQFGRVNKDTFT